MEFDLRELEIFCAVVKEKSFTRAAAVVHLAQASVSERVAKLEQAIGAELLHRSRRGVAPTEIGRRLYEGARRLLDQRQGLVHELQDVLGLRTGTLTVGASTIPGEFILPGCLSSFNAIYPEVIVRIQIAGSESIAAEVAAGTFEIGVVSSGVDHPDLEAQPLWHDELVVAMPAGHVWADRQLVTLDELRKEPLILREPASGTRGALERAVENRAPYELSALRVIAELGSTSAVKEAVLQGLGVSILSLRALDRELESGSVSVCRLEGIELRRSIDLVRHRRRTISPAAGRFVEHLKNGHRSDRSRIGDSSEFPV